MTELRKQTENHNGTMVEIKILTQQGYKTKIMTEERLHKIVSGERRDSLQQLDKWTEAENRQQNIGIIGASREGKCNKKGIEYWKLFLK